MVNKCNANIDKCTLLDGLSFWAGGTPTPQEKRFLWDGHLACPSYFGNRSIESPCLFAGQRDEFYQRLLITKGDRLF